MSSLKPKLFLIGDITDKAKRLLDKHVVYVDSETSADIIYTQLTQINTEKPVFCPCTSIEHIKSPKVIHLDDVWKKHEGTKITSTAEHTWSLILQLAKQNKIQLRNKILGIVGMGRIGNQVKKYAHAFDMTVGYVDDGDDIDGILSVADITTIHVPLNTKTKGMIGKNQFDIIKRGSLLINTSRPQIIEKGTLLPALESSKLLGYADDFADTYKIDHPNVIQTPHIGGNCKEAREHTDLYIAKKIVEYSKEVLNP